MHGIGWEVTFELKCGQPSPKTGRDRHFPVERKRLSGFEWETGWWDVSRGLPRSHSSPLICGLIPGPSHV